VAGALRELRRRINSVESTKQITRAQELIAASRIAKARQRAEAARPYSEALVEALEAVAMRARLDHPLLEGGTTPKRSAVLILGADRGFAGAYTANVIRQTEALRGLLTENGQESDSYVVGRKAVTWHRFRERETTKEYTGISENPTYADAKRIADDLLEAVNTPTEEGGVDEIHVVSTQFKSMVTQQVRARRLFPLVVEDVPEPLHRAEDGAALQQGNVSGATEVSGTVGSDITGPLPLYEFEPSPDEVLEDLLPRYAANLIYAMLLDASASEQAARQRAMKAATDNANEVQRILTREANAARQAEITQEISEIVGGADAMSASAGSE